MTPARTIAGDKETPAQPPASPAQHAMPACLQSNTLLQGQSSVAIQHNGTVYRLQATRLGKLILTK